MNDTPKRKPGRPATGQTPGRSIRIGPVWDEARDEAFLVGEPFADFVSRALAVEVDRVRRVRARAANLASRAADVAVVEE